MLPRVCRAPKPHVAMAPGASTSTTFAFPIQHEYRHATRTLEDMRTITRDQSVPETNRPVVGRSP